MSFFDKTTGALQASIAMRNLRHNVISSNVANAETPGYHAKKIDFEEALQRSIDLNGAVKVRPDIYENPEGSVNNDGNTVDLEKEMSALSENAIMYKAALSLINKKLAAIKYAIGEGR